MRRLLAVAAGGAVGAVLRAAFLIIFPTTPGALPVTILAENVVGAFALGLVGAVLVARRPAAVHLHAFLTTGVIGSFTTFSAVAVDLHGLAEAGLGDLAVAYGLGSVALGLAAAAAGLVLGGRLAGPRAEVRGRGA